jgi:NAD(P)-dependent dehydrogenase (short-subunit alcohol dehydrogenase family)
VLLAEHSAHRRRRPQRRRRGRDDRQRGRGPGEGIAVRGHLAAIRLRRHGAGNDRHFGRLDILYNNAAVQMSGRLVETSRTTGT